MSDYNYGYGRNGGYNSRAGGQPRRRPRYMDQPTPQKSPEELKQEEVTRYLFRLGDASPDQKPAVDAQVHKIVRDFGSHPQIVRKVFKECVTHMPHKVSLYGTLAGLVNVKSFEVGAALVEIGSEALQDSLHKNDFRTTKLTLRYIAELVNANVLAPSQLIVLYDLFLSVLNEPNVRPERADAFIYALLASIPWAASQLQDKLPADLDRVLSVVENYINQRQANFANTEVPRAIAALKTYRDVPNSWPYEQIDRLESLWRQIVQLKQAEQWNVAILYRPKEYDDLLSTQLQHELKAINIPSGDSEVKFSYQPVFRVFDDSVQTPDNTIIHLPSTSSVCRYVLEDVIYDIIRIFSQNHNEVTTMLLNLDSFFDAFFLEDGKFQYLASAVETLFAELLRLPRSGERPMYYATILMDLIKAKMAYVPKMLGRAIRITFSRLDGPEHVGGGMDVEAVRRLSEWFAVHLSNFGYVWKWQDWEAVLSVEQDSACFVFIRETIERCIRLAYWERIQGTIPESFADNEAVFPRQTPGPNYKFDTVEKTRGDEKLYTLINNLRSTLVSKSAASGVSDILQQIRDHVAANPSNAMQGVEMTARVNGHIADGPEEIAREALVQCIMLQGSKSFSHALNIIERYTPILREYNQTEEARYHTVNIIADFWRHNTQFMEIILDKLMNYRVIDPKSILSWALSTEVLDANYTRFYLWTIVRATLAKVNFKVEQLTEKLEAARQNRPAYDADIMLQDGDDNLRQLEDNKSAALREQKETFLHVFQKFTEAIKAKFASFEAQNIDPTTTAWYRWVLGNMREVARGFPSEVKAYKVTLDVIIFDDIDPRIGKVWEGIKSVYAIHTDVLV